MPGNPAYRELTAKAQSQGDAFELLTQKWDGPGGGMMIFPMVLLPAFGGGLYGFALRRKKFQSS